MSDLNQAHRLFAPRGLVLDHLPSRHYEVRPYLLRAENLPNPDSPTDLRIVWLQYEGDEMPHAVGSLDTWITELPSQQFELNGDTFKFWSATAKKHKETDVRKEFPICRGFVWGWFPA